MIKFLGLSDIFTAILLLSKFFNSVEVPVALIIAFSVYVILKGFMFMPDIGSTIDIVAGILLILTLFFVLPGFILIPFAAILGIKGLFSLFA
jgi:hypothetical protein